MGWGLGILVLLGFAALIVAAVMRNARRARLQYQAAGRLWRETAPAARAGRLEALIRSGGNDAVNPGAWYLLGCARLREDRPDLAVRAFGMAHHADWRLESAALLTFACLKTSAAGEGGDLLEDLAATWQEMERPVLPRHPRDRWMFECLESSNGDPPRVSPLGRLAWMAAGPSVRARMKALASSGPRGLADALFEEVG